MTHSITLARQPILATSFSHSHQLKVRHLTTQKAKPFFSKIHSRQLVCYPHQSIYIITPFSHSPISFKRLFSTLSLDQLLKKDYHTLSLEEISTIIDLCAKKACQGGFQAIHYKKLMHAYQNVYTNVLNRKQREEAVENAKKEKKKKEKLRKRNERHNSA